MLPLSFFKDHSDNGEGDGLEEDQMSQEPERSYCRNPDGKGWTYRP